VLLSVELDRAEYAANTSGYVSFIAADAVSGLNELVSSCWSLENGSGVTTISICGDLEVLGGDQYRLPFSVGAWVEAGQYTRNSIYLWDTAGNYGSWRPSGGFYEDTTIPVATMTVVRP
jgi:hypothetical protein